MFHKIKNKLSDFFYKKKNSVPDNWHVEFILSLAKVVRPAVYVELGLYQCELFNKMIPYASHLIGVDHSIESGNYMIKNKKTKFFHCSTGEFCKIATNKKIEIDLLFIDASHDYKSVKNDFLNYFSLIKKNGLILFHDSHPKNLEYTDSKLCGDGYKAIDELTRAANDYEMMTIPVHPGLTICRKRDNHLTFEK
jgi:hypothetical protein